MDSRPLGVTVVDDEPPTINCSTNIVRDLQAGKSNAVVNYTVTATDNLPGVRVVCLASSARYRDWRRTGRPACRRRLD